MEIKAYGLARKIKIMEFEIKIEKCIFGGYGLGFLNRKPVFVDGALPNSIVKVKQLYTKKQSIFAKVVSVIKQSEFYTEPNCKAFGKCGGCNWLHLDYAKQLELKQEFVEEKFEDIINNKTVIKPIEASPQQYEYRNKSIMPIQEKNGKTVIGMYEKQSHKVVKHDYCSLHPKLFDDIANCVITWIEKSKETIYDERTLKGNLRHLGIRQCPHTKQIIVCLVTKSSKLKFSNLLVKQLTQNFENIVGIVQNINAANANHILAKKEKVLFGSTKQKMKLLDYEFNIDYKAFFQVNTFQTENLYSYVKKQIADCNVLLDAYCGSGTIGKCVNTNAEVYGIESSPASIEDAKLNFEEAKFLLGKVEDRLPGLRTKPDVIIFDPPRKGLEKSIIDLCDAEKIIYISCNPATQSRDADLFIRKGYKIESLKAFDMFPNTWHIENVMVLKK